MENVSKTTVPETEQAKLEYFRQLVDSYGARLDRWPNEQRGWAWQFQQDNADAASLLRDAKQLDDLLDKDIAPLPSAALTGKILAEARNPKRQSWREWIGPFWRPASALACAAVIGLAVGLVSPVPLEGDDAQLSAEIDEIGGDLITLAGLSDGTTPADGDRAP